MKSLSPQRYPNLDYLRLGLALSVLWLHGWHALGLVYTGLPFMVPAFLAVSGFVIPQSLERSKGMGHFFWKRFLRVTPAFVAALVVVALVYGFRFVGPTLTCWYTFGLVRGEGKDPVLWSLAAEEVAYIFIAAIFVLGAFRKPIVLWALLLVSVTIQGWIMPELDGLGVNIAMLPSAFLIGNLFYLYRDRLKVNPWIPLGLFVASFATLPLRSDNATLQYLHQCVLVSSVVWVGFAGPRIKWRLPVDISYGVYVYHFVVIQQLASHGMKTQLGIIAVAVLIVVPISVVSALALERPALTLKNWMWWKRQEQLEAALEPEPAV